MIIYNFLEKKKEMEKLLFSNKKNVSLYVMFFF